MPNEENKNENKELKNKKTIKHHLSKKVELPLFLILGLIILIFVVSLFAVRVPYKAKEKYTEIENYVVEVQETIEDKENPITERICKEENAKVRITEQFVYLKKYGLYDYKCYADFKVTNDNNVDGEFIYKFIFDINGKKIETEEKKEYIYKYSMVKFSFETNCSEGDKPAGEPILVSAPKSIICNYETYYPNVTITKNETRQRELLKERIVEKTESLFEKLTGKNNKEKV